MKFRVILLPLLASCILAQDAPAPKPETVIATVDGKKITYGELDGYLSSLGPENKQAALANKKQLIQQYALFVRLQTYADAEKLDDKSPYKEAIAAARQQVLARAAMDFKYQNLPVSAEDQKKFYAENQDRFTQASVEVLYLGFVADPTAAAKDNPGKKYRTEEEAKAKIDELRKQVKSKADFVKLVKEFSEDDTSKNNDGEFGTVKKSDNIPAAIKQTIFSLKAGEMSGPISQRNGYYLFRVDSLSVEPYETVKDAIFTEVKDQRVHAWIDEQNNRPVKIDDEAFFAEPKAPVKN